jgi:hypothetical protein
MKIIFWSIVSKDFIQFLQPRHQGGGLSSLFGTTSMTLSLPLYSIQGPQPALVCGPLPPWLP